MQYATAITGATPGVNNGTAIITPAGGTPPYVVQWDNGGDGTQLAAGTYNFVITDALGCTVSGSITIPTVTSVQNISGNYALQIFPNPASTYFFIQVPNYTNPLFVSVKNVLGQTLRQIEIPVGSNGIYVNTEGLANGTYLIEAIGIQIYTTKPLVVKN